MFTLEIKTSNAAFEGMAGYEVARILREVADTVEERDSIDMAVMDINGNNVGSCKLS